VGATATDRIRVMAAARAAIGASLFLFPKRTAAAYVGEGGATPAAAVITRSMGVRDMAIGIGALLALDHDAPVRGWLEAGMLSDAGDAVALLLGRRHLPTGRMLTSATFAVAGAVAGRRLIAAL
jgi:hypothetical protein